LDHLFAGGIVVIGIDIITQRQNYARESDDFERQFMLV
jgi:hypothetical protein